MVRCVWGMDPGSFLDDTARCLSTAILIGSRIQSDLFKHVERSGFVPYIEAFKKEIESGGPNADKIAIVELKTNHRGWFSNFCDGVVMNKKITLTILLIIVVVLLALFKYLI